MDVGGPPVAITRNLWRVVVVNTGGRVSYFTASRPTSSLTTLPPTPLHFTFTTPLHSPLHSACHRSTLHITLLHLTASPPVFTFDFPQAPSHRLRPPPPQPPPPPPPQPPPPRRSHSNHHCHCHRRHLYSHMQHMPYRSNQKHEAVADAHESDEQRARKNLRSPLYMLARSGSVDALKMYVHRISPTAFVLI